ncbi:MAG: NAD(P)-dependent oxidoreductase [Deltaproteobacteria bacterium]|nr:MAG: NAD(P)-dependent oxidoreductase [Deltaproteobacteria bacterium]
MCREIARANLEEPEVARVVVTGAAGFIGRALCGGLVERGHRVLGLTRGSAEPISGVEMRPIGEITARTHWPEHLGGADIVIHLANRAHRPVAAGVASREAEAAAMLARAAAANGVRRLVYPPRRSAVAARGLWLRQADNRADARDRSAGDRARARHSASAARLRAGGQS